MTAQLRAADCCVIGAGFAGLAAARRMADAGHREARGHLRGGCTGRIPRRRPAWLPSSTERSGPVSAPRMRSWLQP